MKEKNNSRGITLIALVVTIIVLLILAGITIAMLTGQNGILNRATDAKNANGTAQIDEQVKLAVAEALSNGLGTITEANLRAALDNNVGAGNYTLTGDATNGWTIIAGEKTYKINGNGDISGDNNGGNTGDNKENSLGGLYSEPGITEDDIAPNDLFEYEILSNESKTASNTNINLPIKTAKITRIKDQYCNFASNGGTNYEIKYNGITDTLVIPYQVALTNPETGNEEMYKITEVDLSVRYKITEYSNGNEKVSSLPNIENIIYPNTVIKIYSNSNLIHRLYSYNGAGANNKLKKVVLSDNIEEIPDCFFRVLTSNYKGIEKIHMPKNLKKIGNYAFSCDLYYVEAFNLEEIDLTNVETLGENVFEGWTSSQKIIVPFSKNDPIPSGWSSAWKNNCDAQVIYIDSSDSDSGSGSGSGSGWDSGSGSGSGSGM